MATSLALTTVVFVLVEQRTRVQMKNTRVALRAMVLALLTHKPAKLALTSALATRTKPLLAPRPPIGHAALALTSALATSTKPQLAPRLPIGGVQHALLVTVENISRQPAAATPIVFVPPAARVDLRTRV